MKRIYLLLSILFPAFIYAQLPVTNGLVLDLNAATGFTANAWPAASTWTDQSPSHNNLQTNTTLATANPVAATVNGHAAVYFDGATILSSINYSNDFDTAATIFVVMPFAVSPLGTNGIFSIEDTTDQLLQEYTMEANTAYHHSSPSNWIGRTGPCLSSRTDSNTVVLAGAWHQGVGNSDLDFFANGNKSSEAYTTYGTASPYVAMPHIINVGARVQGILYHPLTGYIYRMVAYNHRLSDAEIVQVNNYLTTTYGVLSDSCDNFNGISEIAQQAAHLSVYPNPAAASSTNISYVLNGEQGTSATLKIYNQLGCLMDEQNLFNARGTATIATEHYAAGIYNIVLQSESGSTATVKLIKE